MVWFGLVFVFYKWFGPVWFSFKAKKPNRIETEPGPLLNNILTPTRLKTIRVDGEALQLGSCILRKFRSNNGKPTSVLIVE